MQRGRQQRTCATAESGFSTAVGRGDGPACDMPGSSPCSAIPTARCSTEPAGRYPSTCADKCPSREQQISGSQIPGPRLATLFKASPRRPKSALPLPAAHARLGVGGWAGCARQKRARRPAEAPRRSLAGRARPAAESRALPRRPAAPQRRSAVCLQQGVDFNYPTRRQRGSGSSPPQQKRPVSAESMAGLTAARSGHRSYVDIDRRPKAPPDQVVDVGPKGGSGGHRRAPVRVSDEVDGRGDQGAPLEDGHGQRIGLKRGRSGSHG